MTNVQVQGYLDERILKTTLTSELSSTDDIEVTAVDDNVYISSNETTIVAKVVAADLKTHARDLLVLNM